MPFGRPTRRWRCGRAGKWKRFELFGLVGTIGMNAGRWKPEQRRQFLRSVACGLYQTWSRTTGIGEGQGCLVEEDRPMAESMLNTQGFAKPTALS